MAIDPISSKDAVERRRKWAQAVMQQAVEFRPASSPWEAMARALQAGLAGHFAHQSDLREKEGKAAATSDFNKFIAGVSKDSKTPAPASAPDLTPDKPITLETKSKPLSWGDMATEPGAPIQDEGAPPDLNTRFQMAQPVTPPAPSFTDANRMAESGNRNIPNLAGTSSAFGPHQITEGTWAGVMKNYPQLQLTAEDRLVPEKQDLVMREALEPEYRANLAQAGFDPNDWANMRAMHFLNPNSAVRLLTAAKASPTAPAARFVKANEVEANRNVFFHKGGKPKTVAEVREWLNKGNPAEAMTVGHAIDPEAPMDISPPQADASAPNAPVQVAENNSQVEAAMRILGNEYASDAQKAIAAAIVQKALIPKDPIEMTPGATLYDPNTMKPIFTAPKEQTPSSTEKLYKAYVDQEIAAGRQPKSIEQFVLDYKRAGNPNFMDQNQMLQKEMAGERAKVYSKWMQGAANSAEVLRSIPLMQELISMAPTGPITGRLAEMFPGFSSAAAALDSLIKPLAPKLRVEGSGSTSDIEYQGMLDGYPRLRNFPEANQAIAVAIQNKAQIEVDVGNIINRANAGEISFAEADKLIHETRNRSILTPELKELLRANSAPGSWDAWLKGESAPAGQPQTKPTPDKPATQSKWFQGRRYDMGPDGQYHLVQ